MPASVPTWVHGAFKRRSITFATGLEDARTFVVWVQSHRATGDIRIHPGRPKITASDRLEDMDRATLEILASVEGGVAETAWADGVMSWDNWIGLQPYNKYPGARHPAPHGRLHDRVRAVRNLCRGLALHAFGRWPDGSS